MCVYACIYVFVCIWVCMYLFIYVYIYIYIYIFQLQSKINKVTIIRIFFIFENPPETNSQFTFYSCCLSLLKVSYPFQVWLCYTRGTLATQLIVKTATTQLLSLFCSP